MCVGGSKGERDCGRPGSSKREAGEELCRVSHGKVFDLPSVKNKHTANKLFVECKKINTRQISCLPSVFFLARVFCCTR